MPKKALSGDAYRGIDIPKTPGEKRQKGENLDEGDVNLEAFLAEWQEVPDPRSPSNADYYFNSYAHFAIHEDMLKDTVRTGAYRSAILDNAHLFRDKVVLDVGSGTGILCLFAAKAGAKRCIGVECSDVIHFAKKIAADNHFAEIITYVHGKVEEVEIPVPEIDIIVSEWMGYFLMYESMLDSVLFARNKWLKKGGLMFPDHAKLYMAAIEDADYKEEKIGCWKHMWGFDFSPMQRFVIQEPISDIVIDSSIATTTCCILELDLLTCTLADLDFVADYSLRTTRKDFLHALVVWFDVSFEACSPPVLLSTDPCRPYTHWKQTVLYLDEAIAAHEGEALEGMIAVRKNNTNPRDLDVKLSFEFKGVHSVSERCQYFRLR